MPWIALIRYIIDYILQVRIEQVLVSEPGPVILYKVANLVKFYQSTIG